MPTDDLTSRRKAHAARIRALLAKTTLSGATEAEAFAALAKASELMAKYSISPDALSAEEEGVERIDMQDEKLGPFWLKADFAMALGRFTNCKVWTRNRDHEISFLGLTSDAIFADWRADALVLFIRREVDKYDLSNIMDLEITTRQACDSFILGTAGDAARFDRPLNGGGTIRRLT